MKKIKIVIPDMQSNHCQMRVTEALKKIEEITIDSIREGIAELTLKDSIDLKKITQSIEEAGYPISGIETEAINSSDSVFTFKTNINCDGCVAKVKPSLDGLQGIRKWKVDTLNKDKVLSIEGIGITTAEIINSVQKAGFKIDPI